MLGYGLGKIDNDNLNDLYNDIKECHILIICLRYLICCDDKEFEDNIDFIKTLRQFKQAFEENKNNEVNNNDKE